MNWTAEWQDGGETGESKSSGRGWNLVSLCSTCLSFTREKGCWAWGWRGGLYRASGGRWTKCSAAFLRLISNWKQIYGVMTVCAAAYDSFSKWLLILCIYIAYWWFWTRVAAAWKSNCKHDPSWYILCLLCVITVSWSCAELRGLPETWESTANSYVLLREMAKVTHSLPLTFFDCFLFRMGKFISSEFGEKMFNRYLKK